MIEKIKETYVKLYERLYNDLGFSMKYFLVCLSLFIYIKVMRAVMPNNPTTDIVGAIYVILTFVHIHAGLQRLIDQTK